MTPTPFFILLVALFWTLPASAAAYVYKKHGASLENVKHSTLGSIDEVLGSQLQPQPIQSDA